MLSLPGGHIDDDGLYIAVITGSILGLLVTVARAHQAIRVAAPAVARPSASSDEELHRRPLPARVGHSPGAARLHDGGGGDQPAAHAAGRLQGGEGCSRDDEAKQGDSDAPGRGRVVFVIAGAPVRSFLYAVFNCRAFCSAKFMILPAAHACRHHCFGSPHSRNNSPHPSARARLLGRARRCLFAPHNAGDGRGGVLGTPRRSAGGIVCIRCARLQEGRTTKMGTTPSMVPRPRGGHRNNPQRGPSAALAVAQGCGRKCARACGRPR